MHEGAAFYRWFGYGYRGSISYRSKDSIARPRVRDVTWEPAPVGTGDTEHRAPVQSYSHRSLDKRLQAGVFVNLETYFLCLDMGGKTAQDTLGRRLSGNASPSSRSWPDIVLRRLLSPQGRRTLGLSSGWRPGTRARDPLSSSETDHLEASSDALPCSSAQLFERGFSLKHLGAALRDRFFCEVSVDVDSLEDHLGLLDGIQSTPVGTNLPLSSRGLLA